MSDLKIPEWLESPEFAALRDNNLPPSDEQKNILLDIQSLLKDELGDSSFENAGHRLRNEDLLNLIQTVLSPIKALPDDILIEVFLQCLPDRFTIQWQHKSAIAPMLLTHICSSWRSLALKTPSLWTTFHVDSRLIMASLARCTYAIELCKMWYSRAKNLPLNFCLLLRSLWGGGLDLEMLIKQFMKETLFCYLPRIRVLSLESDEPVHLLKLLNEVYTERDAEDHGTSMTFDALEALQIGHILFYEEPVHESSEIHLMIFKNAPRLRQLEWNMAFGQQIPHLPWKMLTTLSASCQFPSQIDKLVRQCHNLRHGAFKCIYEGNWDEGDIFSNLIPQVGSVSVLENLRSMLIINEFGHSLCGIFNNIEFPALTALFLAFPPSSDSWHMDMKPFLSQPHNIQRLALLNISLITAAQLTTLLLSTPHLVELELKIICDHSLLFEELIISKDYKNGNESLIPHLQTLLVDYHGDYRYYNIAETFSAMVQSRWGGSGNMLMSGSKCLHSVSFFIPPKQLERTIKFYGQRITYTPRMEDMLQEISDRLQPCVDAGLELNLHRPLDAYWDNDIRYDIINWHNALMAHQPFQPMETH
ncbi:hypothetical protein BDQ12DRAFT_766229 [Crucibulum laeve]|uniref:Uncharacterized protein n=1 Tax=Crucibulum laeve TaxID=68775 RepID=A0A5C3LY78_9AGAR|nr:hypothetical protein BDQ12DRAFT_766229 [Crucibulum laeve]